jgi:light-regulated signal transduction histidine kinase (bacteriophytochrome)
MDNSDEQDRREQLERELEETTAELQRTRRALDQFVSAVSHDLKAPLQKVRGFANLLEQEYRAQLGDDGIDYLSRLTRSVRSMERLVDDLVTLARVRTSRTPFTPVDLAAVVRAVVANLHDVLQQTGGRVEISDSLPTIDADATQMLQLLHQLVANSLKFRRDGRPPVVRLSARVSDGDMCEIEITDNGIGFQSRYAEQIFRPFERLHGPQQYEGSGMGLAICAQIVERHGGTITAAGRPGEGATFVVRLPVRHVNGTSATSAGSRT